MRRDPARVFCRHRRSFEVMAAPGLVNSLAQGEKVAADPEVRKLMLALGDGKGLHGVAIFSGRAIGCDLQDADSSPCRLQGQEAADLRLEIRDRERGSRLGATPVAMSLGDVLPACSRAPSTAPCAGMGPFTHMHFSDAAKYITMTNQPAIFLIAEINKKWYDSLPLDLQKIIDKDAAEQAVAIGPVAVDMRKKSEAAWTASGGEEISLPPDEQVQMMKTLSSVGADVSKSDPQLAAAYKVVTDAAGGARGADP